MNSDFPIDNTDAAARPPKHANLEEAMRAIQQAAPEAMTPEQLYYMLKATANQVLLKRGSPTHTIPPTALVHEFLLWVQQNGFSADAERNASLASEAGRRMRDILRTYNRYQDRHHAARHSSRVSPLESFETPTEANRPMPLELRDHSDTKAVMAPDLARLSELLTELAAVDLKAAAVVNMRFFLDMTNSQIAEKLACSDDKVIDLWQRAQQWLRDRMR